MIRLFQYAVVAAMVVVLCTTAARAQIVVPGADGSDGVFNPTVNTVIDLSLAPTGMWNGPNTSPGNGVYDPEKWAVVFRYSSVNIPAGVTVTFKNNVCTAPVVWLVSGNVTIAGGINLDGGAEPVGSAGLSTPGPGGFRGGRANLGGGVIRSAGFGPGGARFVANAWTSAGHATSVGLSPAYGSPSVVPLIGGSGSSGRFDSNVYSGGAGGGAILIAAANDIVVGRSSTTAFAGISANALAPNSAQGSGGAIRLIANTISKGGFANAGQMTATGGAVGFGVPDGSAGRIRLESNDTRTRAYPETILKLARMGVHDVDTHGRAVGLVG